MDIDTKVADIENELRSIAAWRALPVTQALYKDSQEEQESIINLVLEVPVTNIETFLAREQALGHLRGLRRTEAIVSGMEESLRFELKQLPK